LSRQNYHKKNKKTFKKVLTFWEIMVCSFLL
jgi:hypothetical protein